MGTSSFLERLENRRIKNLSCCSWEAKSLYAEVNSKRGGLMTIAAGKLSERGKVDFLHPSALFLLTYLRRAIVLLFSAR